LQIIDEPAAELAARLTAAAAAATGVPAEQIDPAVRPTRSAEHGDVQANLAMALAKRTGVPAREVAEQIVEHAEFDGLVERAEIAGSGPAQAFINLRYDTRLLDAAAAERADDPRGGVPVAATPERVIVDYSSPNVAKAMHVGHLRSTVIGDCLARVLAAVGHEVIRQNHLGDWGTQFGMLTEHLIETGQSVDGADIHRLVGLYQAAKHRFDTEPDFQRRARERVVGLQSGDERTHALWQQLISITQQHIDELYARLDITLTAADVRGESFYNERLGPAVDDLAAAGVTSVDQGALVVRDDRYQAPMIVRKSDGGFGYSATDLAAVRFRTRDLDADRLVYVTDSRQAQHFAQVFDAARRAGWLDHARAEHVPFGTVVGPDGKPFKTRSGQTVSLEGLLDEAEQRAFGIVTARAPELPEAERRQIARSVAVAAIKYADLSSGRTRDYTFDVDRMVSFSGDTGPYLQYAHRRCGAVLKKAERHGAHAGAVHIAQPAERQLALKLMQFPAAVSAVADTLEPHRLCGCLHELAAAYSAFYETCPVIQAPAAERASRLTLCRAVETTLRNGLELIGVRTIPRM
jgi:arginyl-tRNA synthetase